MNRVDEYGDTIDVTYTYDSDNLRTGKTVDGITERYTYDEQANLALVFDGDGNLVSRYLYGMGMDSILAEESADGMVWALTDHQGSVTQVVNEYGDVVEEREFSAFGVGEFVSFRFGYTGREYDAEAEMYYYRNRYYDQQVGKFISSDPIAFEGGDRNLFRYVGNDAVNKSDPSGMQSDSVFQDDLWLIEGIIGLGGAVLSGIGSGISSLFNRGQEQSSTNRETETFERTFYLNPPESKGQLLTFPLGSMIGREIEVYKPDSSRFNPNDINIRKLGDVCVDTLKDILKPNGFPLNDGIKLPPYFEARHHTIPREIYKPRSGKSSLLPRHLEGHPDIKGKAGNPNIWDIPDKIHAEIHNAPRPSDFNSEWKKELRKLERDKPDKSLWKAEDILKIRDRLAEQFGLSKFRPQKKE